MLVILGLKAVYLLTYENFLRDFDQRKYGQNVENIVLL